MYTYVEASEWQKGNMWECVGQRKWWWHSTIDLKSRGEVNERGFESVLIVTVSLLLLFFFVFVCSVGKRVVFVLYHLRRYAIYINFFLNNCASTRRNERENMRVARDWIILQVWNFCLLLFKRALCSSRRQVWVIGFGGTNCFTSSFYFLLFLLWSFYFSFFFNNNHCIFFTRKNCLYVQKNF